MSPSAPRGPLQAVICGDGDLPREAAEAARAAGRAPLLIGIRGAASADIEAFDHEWFALGEVGRLFRLLQARGIAEVAFVGALKRPQFRDLKLDWGAVKRAPELASIFRGGDDRLLRGVASIFEREGFRIVGVHQIAPGLIVPPGVLGTTHPNSDDQTDIARGAAALTALSPFDVGQAAVVVDGRVVAIEAAEGTDAMIERIAQLRATGRLRLKGRKGVLIKAPKVGQDRRVDLPTVGPATIAACVRADLRGLALAAGGVLTAGRAQLIAAADAAGLFVWGFAW